jgi:hypothetical protein
MAPATTAASRAGPWGMGECWTCTPDMCTGGYPNLEEVLLGILLYMAGWTLVCGPMVVAVIRLLPLVVTLCMAELGVELHRCFIGADRWALQMRLLLTFSNCLVLLSKSAQLRSTERRK